MVTGYSLYYHIPFCSKKCPYCHFYVVPDKPLFHALLSRGLALEWEEKKGLVEGLFCESIYFGGGTPSLFPKGIATILSSFSSMPQEVTLEANPEEVSLELLRDFRALGINRLSLGVQSFVDTTLQMLERKHSAKKALQVLDWARKAGFENVSIDLLFDVPSMTRRDWEETLAIVQDVPIDHLSLYNLTIEPHTSFHKRKKVVPPPEESRYFLERALGTFEKMGLHRYEISAFAKKGKESHHNMGYWTNRPFLGLGPSAHSFWEGSRFANVAHLWRYTKGWEQKEGVLAFRETLSQEKALRERVAVQLRLLQGVEVALLFPSIREELEPFFSCGWVEEKGGYLRLTREGMFFYDEIASAII